MHPLLLPGIAFGTGLAAILTGPKKPVAPPVESAVSMGYAADGSPIRAFKLDVASLLLGALSDVTLQEDPTETAGAVVFKVIPKGPEDLSAAQAITAAHAEGLVVLGSLSLIDVGGQGEADHAIVFCDPSQRKLSGPTGQLAILLDVPVQLKAGPRPPMLDVHLPGNVAGVVRGAISDPSPDTARLRTQAETLRGRTFSIAADALIARADAVDLERSLAGSPDPTPVPEIPEVEGGETVPPATDPAPESAEPGVAVPEEEPVHLNGSNSYYAPLDVEPTPTDATA